MPAASPNGGYRSAQPTLRLLSARNQRGSESQFKIENTSAKGYKDQKKGCPMSDGIEISEIITSLTKGIRHAAAESKKNAHEPIIQLSGCEIELAVTAKAEGKAGLKFWLLDAGASVAGEKVSKITLKFEPTSSTATQFTSRGGVEKDGPAHKRKREE
mgnify:CR=1 FL=1